MRLPWLSLIALGLSSLTPATARTLSPTFIEQAETGHQKVWHTALDLRSLPADSRPSSLSAEIDASNLPHGVQGPLRITLAINGIIAERMLAEPGRKTRIHAELDDRLLSTHNRISVAVTSLAQSCPAASCSVTGVELAGPIQLSVTAATPSPRAFPQIVTRFRMGVDLKIADPRDRLVGERVLQAIAPLAPRRPAGPGEIIVSRTLPQGVTAPVRFDTGPVAIKDRDGHVLYDRARLDRLTLVQLARRGDQPLLWVRPGTEPLPVGPLQLDHGDVALFGAEGREIAFAAGQDGIVSISYEAETVREARTGLYLRMVIGATWLLITAGFVLVLRRMAPIEPAAA